MAQLDQEERLKALKGTQSLWKLAVVAFALVPVVGLLAFLILHLTIGVGTWLAVSLGVIFGSLWGLAAWNLNYMRRVRRMFE